jgi:hypothetical protein
MENKESKKLIIVDEKLINSNDPQAVIEPVWFSVSIYDGEEKYEEDLKQFTVPQRYVFAIQWYVAEVNNGGHDQFYFNSTGIVWEDALKGFEVIGVLKNVDIVKESVARMGGKPSKDRDKRNEQLEQAYGDDEDGDLFGDLDDLFYKSESEMDELLNTYIKANTKDFLFSGEIVYHW